MPRQVPHRHCGRSTASPTRRRLAHLRACSAREGSLLPALTILLTIYIAIFAFALITGRSRLGVSVLTPRMMMLGLVLTFATSWMAWQQVVWNLAVGAPDQIAGLVMGETGSASVLFADRIDMVVAAIAEAAAPGASRSRSAAGSERG